MDVEPKFVEFFRCMMARQQETGSPAARIVYDDVARRAIQRDPAIVKEEERVDAELATRLSLPEAAQFGPQSVGVIIACAFEFNGERYGLAVPLTPPGGFTVPEDQIPVLHVTAADAHLFGVMLRDLAWSHAESQRTLRAGATIRVDLSKLPE